MNRSVVNAVSVIGKMGGAERHFPDDKKMGKAVTVLESESVTAHEVSNNNTKSGSGSKDSESEEKLNSSEKKVYKSKVISPFFMVGL